ncbi:MAG: hypothetical protein ABI164_01915 [Acidobacteriaceae bacterium]
MNIETTAQDDKEVRRQHIRFRAYWISAVVATLIFLLFTYVMSMTPGLYPHEKLWMLATAGVLPGVSLVIGVWKFRQV